MTIKEVIEKIKNKIIEQYEGNTEYLSVTFLDEIMPDLEKANELQEEMAKALNNLLIHIFDLQLIACEEKDSNIFKEQLKKIYSPYIKLLEKYDNKSWENIIKDGE